MKGEGEREVKGEGVPSLQLNDSNFTQQKFLQLLKGLFIIAELTPDAYFMPCVLPLEILSSDVREFKEHMNANKVDGPLLVSFHHKMSPRGLFCALLVALARTWRLSKLQDGCYRSRNLVEFDIRHTVSSNLVSSCIGKVAIVNRNSHLEIYTTCESNLCSSIRQTVYDSLEEACISLNYNPKDLTFLGFKCTQCNSEEFHSTDVSQDANSTEWKEKCSANRTRRIFLSKEKKAWFDSDTSSNGGLYLGVK